MLDTQSEAETRALARACAAVMEAGQLVALSGPLGAGKTAWVRGLCDALGVPRDAGVASPSFALIHQYAGGRVPVAHADLYRVDDIETLEGTGFFELCAGEWLVVVEWAERVREVGASAAWRLAFEDRGGQSRRITVSGPTAEATREVRRRL